jgi:LmbE family N-acetylglucosaminyl deacetylase
MLTVETFLPTHVGTLLGIWAHPDDEAYLSAGLMATVRESGSRVAVVTATRGESGTDDPAGCPPERLAQVRERELQQSLDIVGVREHAWLGHRDGELPEIPHHRGVTQIRRILRRVRPDTIVTFGPDGMTGHADHQTISSWVTEAWRANGSREALWYATLSTDFHERWGSLNDEVGLWFEGSTPPATSPSDMVAQVHCTDDLLARKYAALRAHASQTRPLEDLVGSDVYRDWWAVESFVAAPLGG